MTPDSHPARRPWYRFTIRRAMLAVPVVALIVVLVAGIDPFRRDPMQYAIDKTTEWCRIPTASFDATHTFDWSTKPPKLKPDKPAIANGPCVLKVLKVDYVIGNREVFQTFASHYWIGPDGRCGFSQDTGLSMHWGGGVRSLAEIAAIRQALPTLPASQWSIPPGPTEEAHWVGASEPQRRTESRAVMLGFHDGKAWVTRVYNRKNLPPEVARISGLLGIHTD